MGVFYNYDFGNNFSGVFYDKKGEVKDRKFSYYEESDILEIIQYMTLSTPSKDSLGKQTVETSSGEWVVFTGKTMDKQRYTKKKGDVMYAYNERNNIAVGCLKSPDLHLYTKSDNYFTVDGFGVKKPYGLTVRDESGVVDIFDRDKEYKINPSDVVKKVTQGSEFRPIQHFEFDSQNNLLVKEYQDNIEKNRNINPTDGGDGIGVMETEMSL